MMEQKQEQLLVTVAAATTTPAPGVEARRQAYLEELGSLPTSYQQYLDRLSPEKRKRVMGRVQKTKHGLHAVAPLQCLGPRGCPFLGACPLVEVENGKIVTGPETDYPIGQHCLLEAEYIIQKTGEYFVHLEVDPLNPIETAIVQELALLDLQKNRALLILSHGDRDGQGRDMLHVDISVTGYDDEGGQLTSKNTKIHPVLDYIGQIERRREKWLDRLMETRKAKADWVAKMGGGQQESRVLVEIQEMRKVVSAMLEAGTTPLLPGSAAPEAIIGLDEEL